MSEDVDDLQESLDGVYRPICRRCRHIDTTGHRYFVVVIYGINALAKERDKAEAEVERLRGLVTEVTELARENLTGRHRDDCNCTWCDWLARAEEKP